MDQPRTNLESGRLKALISDLRLQTPEPALLRCTVPCQCSIDLETLQLLEPHLRDRSLAQVMRLALQELGRSIRPRDIARAAEAVRLARRAHGKRACKAGLNHTEVRRLDALCASADISRPAGLEAVAFVFARVCTPTH